jgi:hypothetical protein
VLNPHLSAGLHHVLERAQLLRVRAAARSERARAARPVLGDRLNAEAASSIICLVFVVLSRACLWSAGLREGPFGHVLLIRWVRTGFGGVSAWANSSWC